MRLKRKLAAALVRLYPARWRREYGAELAGLLAARPLTAWAVLDVLWNSMRQQVRVGDPWIVASVPLLAWNVFMWSVLILYPPPYQRDSFTGGWPSSLISVLVLLSVGFWTVLRDGAARGGRAAAKAGLLMNLPQCLIAVLAGLGILRVMIVGPGDPVTTFHEHGFAITFYDHARRSFSLFGMFLTPFLGLPEMLLLGWAGGKAAKAVRRRRDLLHR